MSKQTDSASTPRKHGLSWKIWLGLTVVLVALLTNEILSKSPEHFSPGELTTAHHQIELACTSCHTDAFGGLESIDRACETCHNAQLNAQKDSHPAKKFTDPRNADRLEKINALSCVACHMEHHAERDVGMAVTVADDFCIKCHADVDEERPTHKGYDTMTCATAGCHNYHDNSALYEDFLMQHQGQPNVLAGGRVAQKNMLSWLPGLQAEIKNLAADDMNASGAGFVDAKIVHDWQDTAHANAGVNCNDCHRVKTDQNMEGTWTDHPEMAVCDTCHSHESKGFVDGKHGMRLAVGLDAMTVSEAKLAMRPNAHDKTMTCMSCHSSHRFDVTKAAVEGCLSCHNDEHSQNYMKSKHYSLWLGSLTDQALAETGVSCATCHMPRTVIEAHESQSGLQEVHVQHNQSLNLRPNEKMVRTVCLNCHGLQFTLDSLADEELIKQNFSQQPAGRVESLDWAKQANGGGR